MRYCKFNFNADMESLEALIKEKRFENYYDGPVPTINNYIIRNIKNDIAILIIFYLQSRRRGFICSLCIQ